VWTAAAFALALSMGGCSTPGAVAPATMPWSGKYVELSGIEEASSCGYTVMWIIPVKNPKPVAEIIEELIKGRGGDALIQVSSHSSTRHSLRRSLRLRLGRPASCGLAGRRF
jgi:hypothetical protein